MARDLGEVTAMVASVKAEATAWLSEPSYEVLRFRLEEANYSAVEAAPIEARRRVQLNEKRER